MNEIETLKKQVADLMKWKEERTRQQLTYPLDNRSLPALNQYYLYRNIFPLSSQIINATSFGNTTIGGVVVPSNSGNKRTIAFMSTGSETIDNQGSQESSANSQLLLEDYTDSTTLYSFLYCYRKPIYVPKTGLTFTVTSAGSTLTDSDKKFTTDELSGAYIDIYDSTGTLQFTRQIASNTSTVVTIDGTWPATVNNATYSIFMPVFLGNPSTPWRQLYIGGHDISSGGDGSVKRAIRIGYGTTGLGYDSAGDDITDAGRDTIGIFFGTSSPEGVVSANIGSLFLRTDGGTTTTLYVKTAATNGIGGTSNTGWTAK